MIRPFTLLCMVSAFGAGLYLYQSKHHAQVLDREIMRTIKQAEVTRDRTGMLRAEWALLNEPDRLADLAKAHTTLTTLKPTQFVALADLAGRLPAPAAVLERLPQEAEPEEPVVAQAAPALKPRPDVKPATAIAETKPTTGAAEPKPATTVAEAKPVATVAEAKPASRPTERSIVEKPTVEKLTAERPVAPRAPTTVQVATVSTMPAPVRAPRPHPPAEVASSDATAPGTVGAAVLRAMRSQNGGGYAQAAEPAMPPPRTYAPRPVYAQPAYAPPAYAQPAYAQPAYAQPAYAQPAYAAPSASMLGGHATLPPPVPFASR